MKRVEKENSWRYEEMKRIKKEVVKRKTLRKNEFGLVSFLP